MFQEEEDSLEAAMEGGRLEGNGDLHKEENLHKEEVLHKEEEQEGEEGEEGDTRGLTRSALGPAVGETSLVFRKKSSLPSNLFPIKVRHPARAQTETR